MSTLDSNAVQASEQGKDTVTVKVYRPIAGPSTSLSQVQSAFRVISRSQHRFTAYTADLPESQHPTTHELAVAFSGQSKNREKLVDGPMLTSKVRRRSLDSDTV